MLSARPRQSDGTAAGPAHTELLRLAPLYDLVPDPVVVEDLAGEIVAVNDAVLRMTGWPAADLLSRPARSLIPPRWYGEAVELRRRAAGGEEIRGAAGELLTCQVTTRPVRVSVTPLRSRRGKVIGLAVLYQVAMIARRAVETLRESEERFQRVAQEVTDLVWLADENGRTTWVNCRWHEVTGVAAEDVTGWGWQKLHHPHHLGRVVRGLTRAITTGEAWEDRFPLRHRDGGFRWYRSRSVPVRAADGAVTCWIGTAGEIPAPAD